MKTLNTILLIVVFSSLAVLAAAAEMGVSGGHDLDRLWARAQAGHDLAAEDAVLLLESRRVTLGGDGTLATRVHRVAWIGTAVGIRTYADLRVPWNTTDSKLDVEILRTWRDGRWWPDPEAISGTAVVPTLPHAVNRADDYTTMRETMLLHDGVELPCIMETAYTITETGAPATDGLFVMAQRDPAVLVEWQVTVPASAALQYEVLNAQETPTDSDGEGTRTVSWTRDDVPALLMPLTDAPAAYEPAVVWSTWPDWAAMRDHWRGVFDQAAVLDAALTDSLQSWVADQPSRWSRIQAVADKVNLYVGAVHYDPGFWRFSPRPAVRTWETAYGHPLDRAVLAAALLRGAGYEVTPIFVGTGNRLLGPATPRLGGWNHMYLDIKGDPAGLYDPEQGVLTGQAPLIGLPLWRTDQYVEPFLGQSQWPNRLAVTVTLTPGQDDTWQGTGQFDGAGVFCPQGVMAGLDDGAHDFMEDAVGSVLPGAQVNRTNPEIFHQHQVIFGFALEMAAPEADAAGRRRLTIGPVGGGLLDRTAQARLFDDARQSPVALAGPLEQSVKIRLQDDPEETVTLPAPVSLVNEAGQFTLTAVRRDGWITVVRELKLAADSYPAAMWPQLRALLQEEADPVNGTILLD